MKIKLKKEQCFDVNFIMCSELFKETKKFFNNRMEVINKLQYLQNSELSDEEFYKTASEIYEIDFAQRDLLQMSSEILKREVSIETLKTALIYTETLSENQDKDFDWWTEFWFLNITVACTNDSNLNNKYRYSREELQKLIDDKKIIILDFSVGNKAPLKPEEQKEAFLSKKFLEEKSFLFINTNFISEFVLFLRKIIDSDKLKKDLEEVKNNTQDKLIQIKEKAEYESLRYMRLMDMSNQTSELCDETIVLKLLI